MQTDLTPRETALPAKREPDPYDAFQQATKDDLVLPTRTLVQAVSRKADVKRAGEFWEEISDVYKPEMLVALISMGRERSMFERDSFDEGPLCASDDAVKPREVREVDGAKTGPTCEDCHFSDWGTGKEGKGQACRFSYALVCYDLDDSQAFVLRVSGASIGAWKRYLTNGQRTGVAAYAIETVIGSEHRTTKAGAAHFLTFKAGTQLPEDTAEFMREKVAEYQGAVLNEPPVVDVDDLPFE